MSSEIPWLDRIVREAGMPAAADLEGAVMIHNEVSGDNLSMHTYRRHPVPYIAALAGGAPGSAKNLHSVVTDDAGGVLAEHGRQNQP